MADKGEGWITSGNSHAGYSATFYRAGVGLVALWQPTWTELLVKLGTYNADGTKRRDGRF